MNLTRDTFGRLPDGRAVDLYTLRNDNGVETAITTYGGIIVTFKTPDRKGALADITLGFDSFDGYLGAHPFFGALIGRYANRIANGRFALNGKTYQIPQNDGTNALHGGKRGFDKVLWHASGFMHAEGAGVTLNYLSADGEEGFPGNLSARVTYTLRNDNALQIDYAATTDADTVLNLTNHAYFNLNPAAETIYDHVFHVNAERYAEANEILIPSGAMLPMAGTPFDFSQPRKLGERIRESHTMLKAGRGYDVGYLVAGQSGALRLAARMSEPVTGRVLEVFTTEPDCHLYTGGFLDGIKGKGGKAHKQHGAFCLETQHFPDAPNNPKLPSTLLRPGEVFMATTVFKPGVAER
jgi:aldose 1-epimerase